MKTNKLIWFLLVLSLPSLFPLFDAQVPSESFTVGINYSSSDNRYSEGGSVFDQDFKLFSENGVTYIMVQAKWRAFEDDTISTPTNHVYRPEVIENFQILLQKAHEHNLKVVIDFWFHSHSFSTYWRPSYATNNRDIYLDPISKQAWLDFVSYVVTNLKGCPGIYAYTAMNEPFYDYASDRQPIEDFIAETISTIKSIDNKPVSVRFASDFTPWTSRFSYDILDHVDFVGITEYLSPDGDTYLWEKISSAVEWCNENNKKFWIFEFGNDSPNDEIQRQFYEDTIEQFYQRGIRTCAAWNWQSVNPAVETFNIAYGVANPRPAFYELAYVPEPPPEKMPIELVIIALATGTIGVVAYSLTRKKRLTRMSQTCAPRDLTISSTKSLHHISQKRELRGKTFRGFTIKRSIEQ